MRTLVKFLWRVLSLSVSFGVLAYMAMVFVCSIQNETVVVFEPVKAIAAFELLLVVVAIAGIIIEVKEVISWLECVRRVRARAK